MSDPVDPVLYPMTLFKDDSTCVVSSETAHRVLRSSGWQTAEERAGVAEPEAPAAEPVSEPVAEAAPEPTEEPSPAPEPHAKPKRRKANK